MKLNRPFFLFLTTVTAVIAAPTVASQTLPAGAIVFTVPLTIESDCSRDVTTELNNWIASVPDGAASAPSLLQFAPNACYRVDGSLGTTYGMTNPAGSHRQHLIFEGNGATIDGSQVAPISGVNRAAFTFMYGQGLTVRHFTIKGNHPSPCNVPDALSATPCSATATGDAGYDARYEFHHGIAFFGSSDVLVANNNIYNVFGDGVTVAQGLINGEHVRNARIEGNTINGTGRMGIGITAANRVIIKGNLFDRISYHVVDLEPETISPVKNIKFVQNVIRRHYLGVIASASGECSERSNYNIIDNRMDSAGITTFPPLLLDPFSGNPGCRNMRDIRVSGNILRRTDGSGGFYVNGLNVTPYHNATVQIRYASNVRILNNRIIQSRIDTSAIWLAELSGIREVKRNDMREVRYVYNYGASFDGSNLGAYDGPEVGACGNITSVGIAQPKAC